MGMSLWGGIFAVVHMKKVRCEYCEVFDKVFMLFSGYGHFFVVSYIEIREKGVSVFMGYYYGFDWTYGLVLLAMVFSMMVGVVFGFIPANRAVKISALEAIRHD